MAIVLLGKSQCAICGEVVNAGDDLVSTTHFIPDDKDPLWRFSDAPMHKACFLDWELREDFVERFNIVFKPLVWGNGTYFQMKDDGTILRLSENLKSN